MIMAVIFDLDDTLFPESDYVLSGFRAVASWAENQFKIPALKGLHELWTFYQNGVRGDTFNRWLASHSIYSKEAVNNLIVVYREHTPRIVAFPEVPQLLKGLRLNYRLGLLSDGYLLAQTKKLSALGLESLFDVIVFSDKWGLDSWKPCTRPFLEVLSQLHIEGSSAVYVADNPLKDFIGAREVDMLTVRIQRMGGEYADRVPPTPAHEPHITLNDLSQLPDVLASKYTWRIS